MSRRYGIDCSVLVRLATGDPEEEYERCLGRLESMVLDDGAEIFVSNQVLGESYIALQHHYGVTKVQARAALISVLRSGLVAPLNGPSVLEALDSRAGCGLLDRLIANDYEKFGLTTLSLDRKVSSLPGVQGL